MASNMSFQLQFRLLHFRVELLRSMTKTIIFWLKRSRSLRVKVCDAPSEVFGSNTIRLDVETLLLASRRHFNRLLEIHTTICLLLDAQRKYEKLGIG